MFQLEDADDYICDECEIKKTGSIQVMPCKVSMIAW
jgi:hypothetical protein